MKLFYKRRAVLLGGIFVLFFSGCTSNKSSHLGEMKYEPCKTGWIDDHTFRIESSGGSDREENDIERQKAQALSAAILMAQKEIYEKLYGYRFAGIDGNFNEDMEKQKVIREFRAIVEKGIVKEKVWNHKDRFYEIIYQVKAKNLKKMVAFDY